MILIGVFLQYAAVERIILVMSRNKMPIAFEEFKTNLFIGVL